MPGTKLALHKRAPFLVILKKDLPVSAGGHADKQAEKTVEMALVGKAGRQRGLGRGGALLQQSFGALDAHGLQVAVRRDPPLARVKAQQGRERLSRGGIKIVQRNVLGVMFPNEITGALHLGPAFRLGEGDRAGIPAEEPVKKEQQELLFSNSPLPSRIS